MILHHFFDSITLERRDKAVIVSFQKPYRVGSTCQANGGVRDDLKAIFNHQSCEPVEHNAPLLRKASNEPGGYHGVRSTALGLTPETSASLGTAANMNNVAIAHETFRDLEVVAIATGGVEGNAGRAGDPASYFEMDGKFEKIVDEPAPEHGTVNVIVLINKEVSRGALFRAVVTATEAKTAVLQELNIYSRYSKHLATGTGTDQIAIASKLGTGTPITVTGKHSKLGEMIGKAVHKAIADTLSFQNQLTPMSRCSVFSLLERFGVEEEEFRREVASYLDTEQAELARKNFKAIDRDPITVATVSCLTHVYDKVCWGIIPRDCLKELLGLQSAEIAAAVSGDYHRLPEYREKLAIKEDAVSDDLLVDKICQSIALGYSQKWRHLEC